MNRFLSMYKTLPAAFALLFSAAIAPAAAQTTETVVANSNFSLTFPAGWMNVSFGTPSDSSAVLMQMATQSTAILVGVPHQGQLTAEEIAAATAAYATDSLQITASGTKSLGSKSFSYMEIKDVGNDSSDTTARVRVYYLSQGNYLFEAIFSYSIASAGTAITEFEGALATLSISASAGLRRITPGVRPEAAVPLHDVLGRTYLPSAIRKTTVPLLRRN